MLHCYRIEKDIVIARSPDDAILVWNNQTGEDYIKDDYGTADDWTEVDDEEYITVSAETSTCSYETLTKPARMWVFEHGRGFLGTAE